MREFVANNPKQLDICLKLLYSENVAFVVEIFETTRKKIAYKITPNADEQTVEMLMEKYRILIS